MIYRAILICSFLSWTSFSVDHGIYISVFEVHHDSDQRSGEIIIKTFSDDLTNALRAMNFNIPQDADPCDETDALKDYLDSHFGMKINDALISWTISDCQMENDTHWVYLKYFTPHQMSSIHVTTDWLTELFGNQQNIVKVYDGDARKNERLSLEKTVANFEF